MKHLVYAIFANHPAQPISDMNGVGGLPVSIVSSNGLAASVSLLTSKEPPLDIANLKRYQAVVDALFRHRTLIPMRYGCVMADRQQIECHLHDHRKEYEAQLKTLDGCAEMGIRVLIPRFGMHRPEPANPERKITAHTLAKTGFQDFFQPPEKSSLVTNAQKSGIAYLNRRKLHYEQEDRQTASADKIIEIYKNEFSGLYSQFKFEIGLNTIPQHTGLTRQSSVNHHRSSVTNHQSPITNHPSSVNNHPSSVANQQRSINNHQSMVSLFFLIPKPKLTRFRKVFQRISSQYGNPMMLNGPWPPYNFVVGKNKGALGKMLGINT